MTNIRDEIVEQRRRRIAQTGHAEGCDVPAERRVPLVPFLAGSGLICEVKRRSPSKGAIAPGLDAVAQAGVYVGAGTANLSVLTVREGFAGSLDDLMLVKQAYPEIAVLRKDFLFDPEDIEVAWRAGADAVLLIAGMLSAERLADLHRRARRHGMAALVELHDHEDIEKARAFKPELVGVNSRDLTTFRIDPLVPLKVKAEIDWPARVVYESGISHPERAAFAAASGFAGILVGEAAVRDPGLPPRLIQAMRGARPARFWPETARRLVGLGGRPLAKICGLTRETDARAAADAGADMLGFVFWEKSPRRADPGLLDRLADIETPKVGVVVSKPGATELNPVARRLLEDGLLDAVQFHGDEDPDACAGMWPVYYRAFRPKNEAEAAAAAYRCPRALLDAAAPAPGGSGTRVAEETVRAWNGPLWLAGGLGPDNVGEVIEQHAPELVDAASGTEAGPGIKDHGKIQAFIRKAHHE